jgi:hypothetical protein
MASLSIRLPVSHIHILPIIVLVITTLLLGDPTLDPRIKQNEFAGTLVVGGLFSILCYYLPLLYNLGPSITEKKYPKSFEWALLLRTPFSYFFFIMRVWILSGISAICVLMLFGTMLNGKVSEQLALSVFFTSYAVILLAHLLYERPRLGHNAWKYTP